MKIYHNDPLPPFNQLTPAEAERLAVLAGECGEVIQAIAKVLRHGYESKNPDILGCPTNREDLETEIGHVLVAASLLTRSGDLTAFRINFAEREKSRMIGRWLHHQSPSPAPDAA